MPKGFNSDRVINGTFGEFWYNGHYLAQITACKMEVSIKTSAITQVQNLIDGQKMIGMEAKGEIKLHHIDSYMMMQMYEDLKAGKTPRGTAVTNLKDPDAFGAERIACYGCLIDKMILIDWEAGKPCEESYSFTFQDWELLDKIEAK